MKKIISRKELKGGRTLVIYSDCSQEIVETKAPAPKIQPTHIITDVRQKSKLKTTIRKVVRKPQLKRPIDNRS